MNPSAVLPKKKVYGMPTLIRYGSLTEMTAAKSVRGMKDNGSMSAQKTG
jgi:hypothetical protein